MCGGGTGDVLSALKSIAVCHVLFLILTGFVWAAEPIRVGILYPFSGRMIHYGAEARRGAALAIEEINKRGGIQGRMLKAIYEDTERHPVTAILKARKLVKGDGAHLVVGIVSSAVAKAVAPAMNDMKTPLIVTLAMTPDITGKDCNCFTFRISRNVAQAAKSAALLASELQSKTWTTIGPDYIYGYQSWDYFRKYLAEKAPGVSFASKQQTIFVPLEALSFKPYVQRLLETTEEGLFVSLYGPNLVTFIREAVKAGLFEKKKDVLMLLATSRDVMRTLGRQMPTGLWLSGHYWFKAASSPSNEHFVDLYSSRYKGSFPDHNAYGIYAAIKVYSEAVAKCGTTESEQVVKALEGLSIYLPVGEIEIRPEDHQGVYGRVLRKMEVPLAQSRESIPRP